MPHAPPPHKATQAMNANGSMSCMETTQPYTPIAGGQIQPHVLGTGPLTRQPTATVRRAESAHRWPSRADRIRTMSEGASAPGHSNRRHEGRRDGDGDTVRRLPRRHLAMNANSWVGRPLRPS
jgi:hypothetical protein